MTRKLSYRKLFQFISLMFLYLLADNLSAQVEVNFCHHARHDIQILNAKTAKTTAIADSRGYNIRYMDAYWNIDPAIDSISGRIEYLLEFEDSINTVEFDLLDGMTVDSITIQSGALINSHASNLVSVSLPSQSIIGDTLRIQIYYQGNPQASGLGAFTLSSHNGNPIVWTLSEPFGSRDWWPTKHDLNDKIDSSDFHLIIPLGNRAAGQGTLSSVDTNGGTVTYNWKHRYPIVYYLVGLAITNYEQDVDTVVFGANDTLEVLNYVYPEHKDSLDTLTSMTIPVMVLFDSLFGDYPFKAEKYGHAEFGWGGGMEHQTMSSMGGFDLNLISHELAHQWFGNQITCGSWSDIWLNEGFATYLSGIAREHIEGITSFMEWRSAVNDIVTSSPNGSVFVLDTMNATRIFDLKWTYFKGAMILHMLRFKLGDADFYQGIRNYLDDTTISYGSARLDDLKTHLETVSGTGLTEFFNDWYYGEGYPRYTLGWRQNDDLSVDFDLTQTSSHFSVSFFESPVPVQFKGLTQDTIVTFDNTLNGQSFSFNPGFELTSVTIDPNVELLRNGLYAYNKDWINGISVSPNPSSGSFLIDTQNPSHLIETIELVSEKGQILSTLELPVKSASYQIDVPTLQPGIYFATISTNQGKFIKKLVRN